MMHAPVFIFGPQPIFDYVNSTRFFMKLSPFFQQLERYEYIDGEISIRPLLCESFPGYISYICTTSLIKGKFDTGKAQDLGIPKGPLYGILKSGKTVALADGREVKAEEVLGPDTPAKQLVIVCALLLHDSDAMNAMLFHSDWNRVHLSPAETIASAAYKAWMNSFGTAVTHIFAGRGCCASVSSHFAAEKLGSKLQRIDSEIFRPIAFRVQDGVGAVWTPSSSRQWAAAPLMRYIALPVNKRGVVPHSAEAVEDEVAEWWKAALTNSSTTEKLDLAQKLKRDLLSNGNCVETAILRRFAENELLFLGTGCAIPSKYRNVSGILLRHWMAPQHSVSILIDVGEGTWQQLLRYEANSRAGDSFEQVRQRIADELRAVWISHPHADHHLGIVTVIAERRRILSGMHGEPCAPLLVVAPPAVLAFLHQYCVLIDPTLREAYIPVSTRQLDPLDARNTKDCYWSDEFEVFVAEHCGIASTRSPGSSGPTEEREEHDPQSRKRPATYQVPKVHPLADSVIQFAAAQLDRARAVLQEIGIASLINVPVVHCSQSYGLILEAHLGGERENFKLVYSGDTRPCEHLVQYGMDATVLIHEATFEDEFLAEAVAKKHSTVGEALTIAKRMRASRTILTHFSQRYPSVPKLRSEELAVCDSMDPLAIDEVKFVIAFDFMRLRFQDLVWCHALVPAMIEAFPLEVEEEDGEEAMVQSSSAVSMMNCETEGGKVCSCLSSVTCTQCISLKRKKKK